jgi:hypothetical protein
MPAYTARNGYVKNIGTGSDQKRFYIGHDERDAIIREARLSKLWDAIKADGWTEAGLLVAKAIAKGEHSVTLPLGHDLPEGVHDRLANLIRIREQVRPELLTALEEAEERMDSRTEAYRAIVAQPQPVSRLLAAHPAVGLAPILSEYIRQQTATIANTGDRGSNAITKVTRAKTLVRMFGTVILKSADDLKAIAEKLANPALKSAHGRIMAATTRRDLFKALREALSMADDRGETLPRGWAKVRIKLPVATSIDLAQWTPEELGQLYQSADEVDRAVLCLGLNFAWTEADMRDVSDGHLFLDRPLPTILAQRAGHRKGDAWIMMVRTKTGCPGLHRLWPETLQAVRDLIARRDRIVKATGIATDKLFVKANGNPMSARTVGNNPGRTFANEWTALLNRAGVKQSLPMKYLRKASQHYMREFAGDDVVTMHARRAKVTGDTMMSRYANIPWQKVSMATDELRIRLAQVFEEKTEAE